MGNAETLIKTFEEDGCALIETKTTSRTVDGGLNRLTTSELALAGA